MTVIKRTKSGEKELDLFPHLTLESIADRDKNCTLTVLSPSEEVLTINPNLICSALQAKDATLNPTRIVKLCGVEN